MLKANWPTEELIQRCLDQDRLAQKEVYQTLYGKMLAVGRRYLRDPKEVAEVLNSSFLTVFQKLPDYHRIDNFEAWVRRIVINKAIDHLRYHKRFREEAREEVPTTSDRIATNAGDEALRMQELYQLIDALPPMARAVFNLYAIDGFAHKEIAEKLEISAATSRWHLSAARGQLQESLKKNEAFHVGVG